MNIKRTAIIMYHHDTDIHGAYLPPAGPSIGDLNHRQILDIIKSYKRFWNAQTKIEIDDNNTIIFTITYAM